MITYVITKNVKGLKNDRYELRPVTYVQGNNRSGKSAILQAIQYAVFGRCDEIGSRGIGALIRSGESQCEIECGGEGVVFRAVVSVNKKGTVSQERTCLIDGKEVTEKEVAKMFGGLPATVGQLMSLTGEEMWRLMMPTDSSAGESGLPDSIKQTIGELMRQMADAGFSTSGIASHLAGDMDLFIRATSLAEAVNAGAREVREKARAVITAIESPPEPYTGPSVGDLKIREKALKDKLASFAEAVRRKTTNEQTISYNNQQLQSLQAQERTLQDSLTPLAGAVSTREGLLEEAKELLERMPDFVDASDFSGTSFYSAKVSELLECISSLNPEHEIVKKSREFCSSLQDYITHNAWIPGEDQYLDNLIQSVGSKAKSLLQLAAIPTRRSVSSAVSACEAAIQKMRNDMANSETALTKLRTRIDALATENVELLHQTAEASNDQEMEAVTRELQEVNLHLIRAAEYNKYISSAQDAKNTATRIKSLEPYFDQLIRELQDFRVKVMEEGISSVESYANEIIKRYNLSPLVLEPVAGKRPSLIIKNQSGSLFNAMSGAERLIYGTSIILAIKSVRKVANSLLFIEGGELDAFYTNTLLLSICRVIESGNVILAHWFDANAVDLKLRKINV